MSREGLSGIASWVLGMPLPFYLFTVVRGADPAGFRRSPLPSAPSAQSYCTTNWVAEGRGVRLTLRSGRLTALSENLRWYDKHLAFAVSISLATPGGPGWRPST